MVDGPYSLHDIPDDQVAAVTALMRAGSPSPTSIASNRQSNGKWTVTALYGPPSTVRGTVVNPQAAQGGGTGRPLTNTRGNFAIDSLAPSSEAALDNFKAIFGRAPSFWGRYMYGPGQLNSDGKQDRGHYSSAENALLRSNGIRVLLIARQTKNVGSDSATGAADAANNINALFEVFPPAYLQGADPNVMVFLDSEGSPSLTVDYYSAWADTLVSLGTTASGGLISVLPAVYGSRDDTSTWSALAAAIAAGTSCAGLWVAAWSIGNYLNTATPINWNDAEATPTCPTLLAPVLAWQFTDQGNGYDASQTNPAHDDILLDRLIMPPLTGSSV